MHCIDELVTDSCTTSITDARKHAQPSISIPLPDRAIVFGTASLIVSRLALLNFITINFQCSSPGVEYLLPLFISFFEFFAKPSQTEDRRNTKKYDDYDDISRTIWDDIWTWCLGSLAPTAGQVLTSIGGFLAAKTVMPSTVFCSTGSQSPRLTVFSQYISLPLDAAILLSGSSIMLSDRSLAERMKVFGQIFLSAGLGIFVTWFTGVLFNSEASFFDLDLGSVTRLLIDAFALTIFLAYGSIIHPKEGPMLPVLLLVFAFGAWTSFQNIAFIGQYQAVSKYEALVPYVLLCVGMGAWILAGSICDDMIISAVLAVCTLAAMTACIIIAMLALEKIGSHPLRTRIYRARIEQDRWERYATISQSLKVAVSEYKTRHGREPPGGFDKWYEFAADKKSVVIDHYEQIRRDIEPFWSVPKGELKSRLKEVSALPNVETILIRDGKVTSKSEHPAIKEMENMIEIFSRHLPDMEIPINVGEQPLILAPWHEGGFQFSQAGVAGDGKLVRRGTTRKAEMKDQTDSQSSLTPQSTSITPAAFRHIISNTCPPLSDIRIYHSNTRDLCYSCAEPQSKSHYLRYYPKSLDICHQSDLLLQHDFHLSSPAQKPVSKLLPLFSRTKTDAFADMLLPLAPFPVAPELKRADNKPFRNKKNRLYWRGYLPGTGPNPAGGSEDTMQKGHTERLIHLLHNATDRELIPLAVPTKNHASTNLFTYEHVRAREASAAMPFDIWHLPPNHTAGEPELSPLVQHEFGHGEEAGSMLDSRFILVQDTVHGAPPPGMLPTVLTSNAAPFVASLFREWYTERLYPWVHFVPLDLRWQGIHGTLSYFTGIKGDFYMPKRSNGIGVDGFKDVGKVDWEGRWADGDWIAEQGKKWAARAVRDEDRWIYAFRLLLEWGRILGDREEFKLDS
ncbi:capsular associated protein [Zalerion maritima]|uniref:Capsular associated protein n=1 Tax=Zalerion maritima TaxID=339359 RepID=A0AAD5RN09_9PEZI|nr:capsular associated protein [Zalerion maritima]